MARVLDEQDVQIKIGDIALEGNLVVPAKATGLVLFAHGSGSSRHSPRNRFVARILNENGTGTLLLDLLTVKEEEVDDWDARYRFDIDLLEARLIGATDWVLGNPATHDLAIGYFGASTGAGAALKAAPERPGKVHAIVSRGGRPDLAEEMLPSVTSPTLLIVGENDAPIIELNERALHLIPVKEKKLVIVPGATHLFEEPGTLEEVARLATEWFRRYLQPRDVR